MLHNTTLDFVASVDIQSFITAIQITLNRYHFGRMVELKFQQESLDRQIVLTARIDYPTTKSYRIRPTTITVQGAILYEDISHVLGLDKETAQSYIDHVVTDILYRLALAQPAKAS